MATPEKFLASVNNISALMTDFNIINAEIRTNQQGPGHGGQGEGCAFDTYVRAYVKQQKPEGYLLSRLAISGQTGGPAQIHRDHAMINLNDARNDAERPAFTLLRAMEIGDLLETISDICTEGFVWANSESLTQAVKKLFVS